MASPSAIKQSIPFVNKSGETMPPFAIFKAKDDDIIKDGQKLYLPADKPDGEDGVHYINGKTEVENDGEGATDESPIVRVKFDTSETPAIGEEWGPIDDEWFISPDGVGFVIRGLEDAERWPGCVQVVRATANCKDTLKIMLSGSAVPTSGSFEFPLTATDGTGTATENIIISYNATQASVQTALESHSKLSADDVNVYLGGFPDTAIVAAINPQRRIDITGAYTQALSPSSVRGRCEITGRERS